MFMLVVKRLICQTCPTRDDKIIATLGHIKVLLDRSSLLFAVFLCKIFSMQYQKHSEEQNQVENTQLSPLLVCLIKSEKLNL